MYDACKMHPWTLVIICQFHMLFAWYVRFPRCFTFIYRDLQQSPLYFLFNYAEQFLLFCVFWTFRDLTDTKWPEDFATEVFQDFSEDDKSKHQRDPERPKRAPVARAPLGRATWPLLAFTAPFRLRFDSTRSAWPKNAYLYPRVFFLERRRGRS